MTNSQTFLEEVIKNNGTKAELKDAAVEHLIDLKECNISCLSRHLRSALETFLTSFAGFLGLELLTQMELILETPENMGSAILLAAFVAAISTALRSASKAMREKIKGIL